MAGWKVYATVAEPQKCNLRSATHQQLGFPYW